GCGGWLWWVVVKYGLGRGYNVRPVNSLGLCAFYASILGGDWATLLYLSEVLHLARRLFAFGAGALWAGREFF
nr:hypothetical protein [Gammaproteobacteria bacterium]